MIAEQLAAGEPEAPRRDWRRAACTLIAAAGAGVPLVLVLMKYLHALVG
jgi:hypothetical protein